MCKIGDILLIYDAKDRHSIGRHPYKQQKTPVKGVLFLCLN